MQRATSATGALLVLIAACGGPPAQPADPSSVDIVTDGFEVRSTRSGLELTNHTNAPVYYRARDPLSLALSDRIPCLEVEGCPSVPAGRTVTVPFAEAIVGYRPETERILVYWWHFVQRADGKPEADLVRTFEVAF
jgi:hypothetical protein